MGDRYAATGQDAATTVSPGTTSLGLTGTAVSRGRIYDLNFGCDSTPADLAFRWQAMRFTAAGTSTAVTAAALDQLAGTQVTAIMIAGENHSAEPTYTAATELIDLPLNQRATYRWVASPGGELVIPAVAANGIGIREFGASGTPAMETTAHWDE